MKYAFLLLSLLGFGYTYSDKLATCTDAIVWFKLKPGVDINCNNYTSVKPSDLIPHDRVTINPLADMAAFTMTQVQRYLNILSVQPLVLKCVP